MNARVHQVLIVLPDSVVVTQSHSGGHVQSQISIGGRAIVMREQKCTVPAVDFFQMQRILGVTRLTEIWIIGSIAIQWNLKMHEFKTYTAIGRLQTSCISVVIHVSNMVAATAGFFSLDHSISWKKYLKLSTPILLRR